PGSHAPASDAKQSIGDSAPSVASAPTATYAGTGQPLPLIFLYAFLGGLLLNIMPCVLPVIALKLLGFASEARNEPRRVRKLRLIYTVGVLSSFLVLALIVLALQAAGKA